MSDTSNSRPDRAIDGFDDEVPTYTPKPKKDNPEQTMYERTGRVAPQVIQPRRDPEPTASFDAPEAPARGEDAAASADPEPTTALPHAESRPQSRDGVGEPTQSLDVPEPADAADAVDLANPADPADRAVSAPAEPTSILPREDDDAVASRVDLLDGAAPAEESVVDRLDEREPLDETPDYRRGTTDLGLLFFRLALAAWLLLDSIRAFFGIGGGGIGTLQESFGGYAQPHLLAIVVPGLELAAGVFLLFGLVTPLFAALATVATAFTVVHVYNQSNVGFNPFTWEAPLVLAVVLAVMSIALQFTGPGLYSLDGSRSWARRPLASSWVFVILGVACAGALWWFGAGTNPFN